ncbi:MAG: glycoside hydrolase family 140 protein [Alistipes sp.]|nr:glycoside hydrolase family 140 protein [Alistipes sp.]
MKRHWILSIISISILIVSAPKYLLAQRLACLQISDNNHYLQTIEGKPFFYMGDTAWELFHNLNHEEADLYLENRAKNGFNVIQAVALSEIDGVNRPNAYGHKPLIDNNPSRPDIKEGENNDYWDNVDYIIKKANAEGMYMGLLPTWGHWWSNDYPIFNPQNAYEYGRWIAERYIDCDIIWILGGDRNPDNDYKQAVIRAMAQGIRSVDKHSLITYHTAGWASSSRWFHNDEWLSFNARQSSHHQRYNSYSLILDDFRRNPAKPIVEIEPLYDDCSMDYNDNDGYSTSWDVRRGLYWSVFYGSAGVTYGHHSVWSMYDNNKEYLPHNGQIMNWQQAIERPTSSQVINLKNLILSRPYFDRVPAEEFIVQDEVYSSVPGAGRYRFVATMDTAGSYAMVYAPIGREFSVKTDMLKAEKITAWWYCPRTGKAQKIGSFANDGQPKAFTPPMKGEAMDYVLVLDDAAKRYPAPGRISKQ